MAIIDTTYLFSDDQAITGDAVSTNVIDLLASGTPANASAALGQEEGNSMIPLLIQVTEDFNTLTSLEITLQKDTVENFASAETVVTQTILLADLVAGAKFAVRFVPHGTDQRYLRINYNVNGTDPTAGKITASLGTKVDNSWGNR